MSTKTSLLDAAETLARTRGFDAFSYGDLAEIVGISKASIHHHFPTKADLALSLVTRYRENLALALSRISTDDSTGGAQLGSYLSMYKSEMHGGAQLCLCISFSVRQSNVNAQVTHQINRFQAESLAWLEYVFEKGQSDQTIADVGETAEEAFACFSLVKGAQLIVRVSGDVSDFDLSTNQLRARLS